MRNKDLNMIPIHNPRLSNTVNNNSQTGLLGPRPLAHSVKSAYLALSWYVRFTEGSVRALVFPPVLEASVSPAAKSG